jgi:predicted MFS family arabinose efflux permease
MLCAFFGSATFTSISPFLNEMAADFGKPIGVVGQLASASSLAAACSALMLFSTIERLRPKRVLLGALTGVGIFTILTGLLTWFPAVLVAQFVAGGSATTAMTTSLVVLGRISTDPSQRAHRQGLLVGMGGCGPLLGTPLLRLIADGSTWRVAVGLYGAVALVAAAVAALTLPNLPALGVRGGGRLADAIAAARLPLVGRTLALSASVWLIWGILGSFLAGFAEHAYPGQTWVIGALWTTDGISYMVGAFGSGILILRLGGASRAVALALTGAMAALLLFVFATVHPFWSLAMYFIWMGLLGVLNSGIINLLYGFGRDRQAPVLFLSSAIGRVGTFAGGLIGGIALQLSGWGGWQALLLVAALVTFVPLATLVRAGAAPAVALPLPAEGVSPAD